MGLKLGALRTFRRTGKRLSRLFPNPKRVKRVFERAIRLQGRASAPGRGDQLTRRMDGLTDTWETMKLGRRRALGHLSGAAALGLSGGAFAYSARKSRYYNRRPR